MFENITRAPTQSFAGDFQMPFVPPSLPFTELQKPLSKKAKREEPSEDKETTLHLLKAASEAEIAKDNLIDVKMAALEAVIAKISSSSDSSTMHPFLIARREKLERDIHALLHGDEPAVHSL